jgi:hypothetical protein
MSTDGSQNAGWPVEELRLKEQTGRPSGRPRFRLRAGRRASFNWVSFNWVSFGWLSRSAVSCSAVSCSAGAVQRVLFRAVLLDGSTQDSVARPSVAIDKAKLKRCGPGALPRASGRPDGLAFLLSIRH